jgi:hypothetical protein
MKLSITLFALVAATFFICSDSFAQRNSSSASSSSSSSAPPPPVKCDSPEIHAWSSLEDFMTLGEACKDAIGKLNGKKVPDCAVGCTSVKVVDQIHGSQSGFWDGVRGAVLDFIVGDECRVTRRRICVPSKPK